MTKSKKLRVTELGKEDAYIVPFDASIKGNLFWKDKSGDIHVLSEVSPDAIVASTTNLSTKLAAKLRKGDTLTGEQIVQITQSVSELGKRTIAAGILRDALYRLEEFKVNSANPIDTATYKLFLQILADASEIAKAEIANEYTKQQQDSNKTVIAQKKEETKQVVAEQQTKQKQVELEKIQLQSINNPEIKDKNTKASEWEEKGFDLLLNDDIDGSIDAFRNAENIYPTYHNVFEIGNILSKNRDALIKKQKVKEIYSIILKKYSWGMSDDIKSKLQDKIDNMK